MRVLLPLPWTVISRCHRSRSLPEPGEEPNRITCGGPGPDGASDIYWFVKTITSRQLIEASAASQEEAGLSANSGS
jgi:hypothetical protein